MLSPQEANPASRLKGKINRIRKDNDRTASRTMIVRQKHAVYVLLLFATLMVVAVVGKSITRILSTNQHLKLVGRAKIKYINCYTHLVKN